MSVLAWWKANAAYDVFRREIVYEGELMRSPTGTIILDHKGTPYFADDIAPNTRVNIHIINEEMNPDLLNLLLDAQAAGFPLQCIKDGKPYLLPTLRIASED
jgi:hypothetical protein